MGPAYKGWMPSTAVPTVQRDSEIPALRTWDLARWSEDGGLRLKSVSRNVLWHGPVFHADFPPEATNNCASGIYAMKPTAHSRDGFDWLRGSNVWIWGWVSLFGRVIEHAAGYRAEHAIIRKLRLGVCAHMLFNRGDEIATVVGELERRYKCPVKFGLHEQRKSMRLLSSRNVALGWTRMPELRTITPEQVDVPLPAVVPTSPGPAPQLPPAPRQSDPRTPKYPPRLRAKRGYTLDGIKLSSVVRAFQQAERDVLKNWPKGVKPWGIATLPTEYSRVVIPQTKCWARYFGYFGNRYVFPIPVIIRAAKILKIENRVLISSSW